jgi:4-hydroxy-3-polyprenylbenzoate decarboxylase
VAFNSLADFLEDLERAGELLRVTATVDAELEIAAITERVAQAGGPALFFVNVKGQHPPVVTNLLGTEGRICRALQVASLSEMADRAALWLSPAEAEGWLDKIKPSGSLAGQTKSPPRVVKSGLCQQVVKLGRDVDLGQLPVLKNWPSERHPTITAGRVFTRDPSGERAVETVPLAVLDRDRLGVAWHLHHHGFKHAEQFAAADQRMPIAIVLGGDPLYALMAAPLPRGVEPFSFAGLLRGRPVEVVKCRTHDLEVAADADLVIEGFVDPAELPLAAGPIAGTSGYYLPSTQLRSIHVTAITQRANPVYPALVTGRPPHESAVLDRVLERLFLPLVRAAVPELVDYALPAAGGRASVAFVSIRKSFPQQARKAAAGWWGLEHLMFTKLLVIVDEGVNVRSESEVLAALGANVHPGRDVFFHQGPADPADHATPTSLLGHAIGIDATRKLPAEHAAPWPERLAASAETQELIAGRWAEYGLPEFRIATQGRVSIE